MEQVLTFLQTLGERITGLWSEGGVSLPAFNIPKIPQQDVDIMTAVCVVSILFTVWSAFKLGQQQARKRNNVSETNAAMQKLAKVYAEAELSLKELYRGHASPDFVRILREHEDRMRRVHEVLRKDLIGWSLTLPERAVYAAADMLDGIARLVDTLSNAKPNNEKPARNKKFLAKAHKDLQVVWRSSAKQARRAAGVEGSGSKLVAKFAAKLDSDA